MCYDDPREKSELTREWQEVNEISTASGFCAQVEFAEPSWNDEVHSRLLRLALRRIEGVGYANMCVVLEPLVVAGH